MDTSTRSSLIFGPHATVEQLAEACERHNSIAHFETAAGQPIARLLPKDPDPLPAFLRRQAE